MATTFVDKHRFKHRPLISRKPLMEVYLRRIATYCNPSSMGGLLFMRTPVCETAIPDSVRQLCESRDIWFIVGDQCFYLCCSSSILKIGGSIVSNYAKWASPTVSVN